MSLTNNTGSRVTSNEEPLTGQSGPVNLASKMAPKSKKTPPKEQREEKVDKRRKKVVTDVRPDTVPNCPPERNLFLEALGVPSTKSTKSTNNQPIKSTK